MAGDYDITSLQNPQVKHFLSLKEHKKARNSAGLFTIEGLREFQLALEGGYEIVTVFLCIPILGETQQHNLLSALKSGTQIFQVNKNVYERMAYRGKTEGLVAIAKAKGHSLEDLRIRSDNPLILIAENPEKPGNIGAILRTADAAKLDAVIIADSKLDLYNPNVVRSSVGCIFSVPIGIGTNEEVLQFLKAHEVKIYAASLQAKTEYHVRDYKAATAIVVGAESSGLKSFWYDHCDDSIYIPMEGKIDSMNVSVSAAILIFEAKRQRRG